MLVQDLALGPVHLPARCFCIRQAQVENERDAPDVIPGSQNPHAKSYKFRTVTPDFTGLQTALRI